MYLRIQYQICIDVSSVYVHSNRPVLIGDYYIRYICDVFYINTSISYQFCDVSMNRYILITRRSYSCSNIGIYAYVIMS